MKPRKAAVVFIFITVTLDTLAIGLIAPVLPKQVLNFVGGDATSTAKQFGIFGTVFALMQFFFSPVLGVLSDRFGRRPVILLSNLGLGRDYIVMALAPTIGWPLTISAGRTGNIRWAILCALSKAAAIQSLGSALAFQLANQTGDRKASGKTDETFGLAKRGDSGLEIVSMKEARVRRPSRHRHRPNPGDAVARTVHKVFRSIFR